MTAILKVDTIQDTAGNNIINESSDTITIGAAGDTVNVPGTAGTGFGKVLQTVSVETGALITASSNVFPEDDTIPQSNEGTQVMSLAITPVNASSKLHIFVNAFGSHSASTRTGIALFVDSTANALAFSCSANNGATTMMGASLNYILTSASTDARTYKIRMAGMQSSGTLSFNGQSGARKFGGVASSSIIIMEIA